MSNDNPLGCTYADQDIMAFTVLLGSVERARQLIADLQNISLRTPFSPDAFKFPARVLLVYGFDVNDIAPMLSHVCETVQRLGGDSSMLDRIAIEIGKMKAQGAVRTKRIHIM